MAEPSLKVPDGVESSFVASSDTCQPAGKYPLRMSVPKTQYQVLEAYCQLALAEEQTPWPELRDPGRQITEWQARLLGKGLWRQWMIHQSHEYDADTRRVLATGFEPVVLLEA